MGWIIDVVIGVFLLIVVLVNLIRGFQKCGMNNAFTALNIVISCLLASAVSGALLNGPFQSLIENSGESAELMQAILSVGLFIVLLLVFSLLFSIAFYFVKWPLKKIPVKSKVLKLIGRIASICVSVVVYASFFWVLLGVVHTAGISAVDEAIGSSFFYSSNSFQAFCDRTLNIGGLVESVMQAIP